VCRGGDRTCGGASDPQLPDHPLRGRRIPFGDTADRRAIGGGIFGFPKVIDAKLRYDAGSGTGLQHRSRRGVYRWPLRVHTINAVNRPIKASRITNIRIISRSSFPLQVKARAGPGLSRLQLWCRSREPASITFHGRPAISGAAGGILTIYFGRGFLFLSMPNCGMMLVAGPGCKTDPAAASTAGPYGSKRSTP
jgi:hypothetical protein